VLIFERSEKSVGKSGGVQHFGFRLTSPRAIARAAELVQRAGGTVTDHGEFVPGEPYLFARDPDGYVIEIWYEIPTSADPH
jgi:catechol 2,3-dioxygenase-like lactoylglutathione lyase family enzyme